MLQENSFEYLYSLLESNCFRNFYHKTEDNVQKFVRPVNRQARKNVSFIFSEVCKKKLNFIHM